MKTNPAIDLTARFAIEGFQGTYMVCESCNRLSAREDMTLDTKTGQGVCTPCYLYADNKAKEREGRAA